jgi:hypothetical protein
VQGKRCLSSNHSSWSTGKGNSLKTPWVRSNSSRVRERRRLTQLEGAAVIALCVTRIPPRHGNVGAALVVVTGKERKPAQVYLLSDNVCVMGSLGLEGAVIGP